MIPHREEKESMEKNDIISNTSHRHLDTDENGFQTTTTVLMVRPVSFAYNSQTSKSNAFMVQEKEQMVSQRARKETDDYIKLLQANGIQVIVVEDSKEPNTPDSVFPNNWFSTHADGSLVLYPMCAPNRRQERKPAALTAIHKAFSPKRIVDLTEYEVKGQYLEGTGSLVLDRIHKIAYACRSPRTSEEVVSAFCEQMGYQSILFDALDEKGTPIYHTNVMMMIGSEVAVICLETIREETQRMRVLKSLQKSGKEVVEISFQQMNSFAGNMLEVRNNRGEACLLMSKTAYNSLTKEQTIFLQSKFRLIAPNISCIEKNGGGSARCMVAEIWQGN